MNIKEIEYIFVNGLGNGEPRLHERWAQKYWHYKGTDLHQYPIDWFDGKEFDDVLGGLVEHTKERLNDVGGVALIGSSAAGSLVLNAFHNLRAENVCAVTAHGRLSAGDYPIDHKNSLFRRAHLGTALPSQSFYDSVMHFDEVVRPNLTEHDRSRILNLTQLTDLVVPLQLMELEGVHTHRSIAFGHSGGFMAHLYADKGIITTFAETALMPS